MRESTRGGVYLMQFFLPMNPPTATPQMKQVTVTKRGRPRFYEPPAVADARAKLTAHLAPHRPETPFQGPVRLVCKWCWASSKHQSGTYKATKPDTDNLQKLLKDVMTTLQFWHDDAQVASEIIEKFWSDTPGIWVSVEPLE